MSMHQSTARKLKAIMMTLKFTSKDICTGMKIYLSKTADFFVDITTIGKADLTR